MKKIHLTKEYERDISLIVEAMWAQKFVDDMYKHLKVKPECQPFIVFYVTNENMQIWEHTEALSWLQDCLLKENQKGPLFMEKVIAEYKALIFQIEKYWNGGATTNRDALEKYKSLIEKAISLFTIWYYPMVDKRTPFDVKELAIKLRNEDEFFAKNDIFIKDCVEALGVKREFAGLIFPEEFPDLPDQKNLEARVNGIVSVDGKNNFIMTLEQFAAENPEYVFEGLNDAHNYSEEIKGQPAFNGNIKGLVKIVKNKKQMEGVNIGDILVSPMTTPDFLPAMKKAAAFVTDEGGIICHAAIVARELKKPCIIGTKIATKVLKDGDMVEVDANSGIVKILKS